MNINSYTEWDELKSIMVADIDVDNQLIQNDLFLIQGKHLKHLVQRLKDILDNVCEILDKKNINIIRPNPKKFKGNHRFPCLNIRDRLGVIGQHLIEYSYGEKYKSSTNCYKNLHIDFKFPKFTNDLIWNQDEIKNNVPYLEGANLIKCGSIIFTTLKETGNELGISVLETIIGKNFKVIPITTVDNHLDAHINFINNKLMLYDARMDISEIKPHIPNVKTVPILYERIKEIDIVWPDIQDDDIENTNLLMSNTISIDPETVICLNAKPKDINFFKEHNINCITINWPEQWVVNAGLHCFTVDLERTGKLINPFDRI